MHDGLQELVAMERWEGFMDDNRRKKIAIRSYTPYFKESVYCLVIQVLVTGCLCAVFVGVGVVYQITVWPILIGILIVAWVVELLLNQRLSMVALWELKKLKWNTAAVTILEISEEASWSGHIWESVISKLYPSNQRVGRYKLICQTKTGKKLVLRCIMSGKKWQIIQDRIFDKQSTECSIHYGTHTRIVMLYCSQEDWTDKLNHMF